MADCGLVDWDCYSEVDINILLNPTYPIRPYQLVDFRI
jgi:hypothetical protein